VGGCSVDPVAPFDASLIERVSVDEEEIQRRAEAVRSAPRHGDLRRVLALVDLTTLRGDDTAERVRQLAQEARSPAPGADGVASVCVYPVFVEVARDALRGSGIAVCSVAGGFPDGLTPLAQRAAEAAAAVEAGAAEIDVVIRREHVLRGDWSALYREIGVLRDACGPTLMKVILSAGELGTLTNVARAAWVCMMAGADFIKTSTGREAVNATLPFGLAMAGAITGYRELTGRSVGLKAAGGISTGPRALEWVELVRRSLGGEWVSPRLFRIGASSLLADIRARL